VLLEPIVVVIANPLEEIVLLEVLEVRVVSVDELEET